MTNIATMILAAVSALASEPRIRPMSDAPEVGRPLPAWKPGELELHFIATGLGENAFYRFPDGTTWLNDCGDYRSGAKVFPSDTRLGGEWVARYLKRLGVGPRIDYMTISHWHTDHAGDPRQRSVAAKDGRKVCGAALVAEYFDFDIYSDFEYPATNKYRMGDHSWEMTRAYVDVATRDRGLKAVPFRAGALDQFGLRHDAEGKYAKLFHVRNLCANGVAWTGTGEETRDFAAEQVAVTGRPNVDANAVSMALRIDYGPFRYYSGGDVSHSFRTKDGPVDYEAHVARMAGPVTVAKTNHHGTPDTMGRDVVAALRPAAWIGCIWHKIQINDTNMRWMSSREVYPGDRLLFPTWIHPDTPSLTKDCAWWKDVVRPGHVVVKVAPGGESYRIYVLACEDESMMVREVYAGDSAAVPVLKTGQVELPECALRMVPQTGAAMAVVSEEPRHVSIWDYNISPAGEHYFSVCAEGTVSDYARLYRYLPERNEVRRVFRLEDVSITRDEAVRPSKLHSSIDFLPDGRVIMATHTTAAAPNHPRWMPFAYYPDLREGFPGSNILIYDPKTGKTEDLGVPVVHESVYGGTYEASTHSYYFTGYHRGHIYRFDLATRKVTDFGQAVEYGTWRWIHAADGNLYTTTASGRLVRLNVKAQRIEDIPFDFPVKPELMALGTNNKMMHYASDKDGFWFTALSCDRLMRYDIKTGSVTVGPCFVPEVLQKVTPRVRCMGMCADETGTLWLLEEMLGVGQYLVSIATQTPSNPETQKLRNQETQKPVLHGLCGVPERAMGASFGCFVRNGVLFASDTNRGNDVPAVFQVPLKTLRSGEVGPVVRDVRFYLALKDGEALYLKNTGRSLLADAGNVLKERAAAEADRVRPERLATLPVYYREHPEVRFNGDLALNVTALPHTKRWVCKLWKQYGHLDFTALGFLADGTVWAQAGKTRYLMRDGELVGTEAALPVAKNAALAKAEKAYLPYQPERRHLCRATAACEMVGGRVIAGTQDGMLAFVRANGTVFSVGSVGLGQTIHDLVAFPGGKRVLGVASGLGSLGTVFTYDDEVGLVLHGRIFFQDCASPGVLGASNEPRLAAVSPDGKYAAIAVGDRLSCVYWFELKKEIVD